MRVNRAFAVIIAILTVAPWAYLVFFLSYLMPKFMSFTTPGGPPPEEFHHLFDNVFRWHLGIMGLVVSARDGSWRFIGYSPPAAKPAVADSGPPNKRLKLAARVD